MDQRRLIKLLRDILAAQPEVSLVYLFGSQVERESGPLSDVDLGVWAPGDVDDVALTVYLSHCLAKEWQEMQWDVVSLRQAPVELAYAVISGGVCLYQRSEKERVDYEARVLGLYGDYLPVLRTQRAEIL